MVCMDLSLNSRRRESLTPDEHLKGWKNQQLRLIIIGPADLLINGKPVQVKFYANLMNELKTSAEYRSMDMMFSKDHMDVFSCGHAWR